MLRATLADLMQSRFPRAIGNCAGDVSSVANAANEVVQRLISCREVGDTGCWGQWLKMAFNTSRTDPFITLPRGVARLSNIDVCKHPVPIQNQFYEYLEFGRGEQPKGNCPSDFCGLTQAYERNNVVTFTDLTSPNKKVRVYLSDPADANKRVLIGGLDGNGQPVYSLDGIVQVSGTVLSLMAPFVDTPMEFTILNSVQKDITLGPVSFYQVDTVTGGQSLLLTMEPGETIASYRRIFLNGLPNSCCNPPRTTPGIVQVSAMAKLDFVPVRVPTDYLLISSLPALIEEAEAVRYSEMDIPNAKAMSASHHREAVRFLQGQSVLYEGKTKPAFNLALFGTATLRRQRIGRIL